MNISVPDSGEVSVLPSTQRMGHRCLGFINQRYFDGSVPRNGKRTKFFPRVQIAVRLDTGKKGELKKMHVSNY